MGPELLGGGGGLTTALAPRSEWHSLGQGRDWPPALCWVRRLALSPQRCGCRSACLWSRGRGWGPWMEMSHARENGKAGQTRGMRKGRHGFPPNWSYLGVKRTPAQSWVQELSSSASWASLPTQGSAPGHLPLTDDHALPSWDLRDLGLRRPWEVNVRGRGSLAAKAKLEAALTAKPGRSPSACGVTDCRAAPPRPRGTLREGAERAKQTGQCAPRTVPVELTGPRAHGPA